MLNELVKEINTISLELGEQYRSEYEFYKMSEPHVQTNVEDLRQIRDAEHSDPDVSWIAGLVAANESRAMAVHCAYFGTLNALTRLSLVLEHSVVAIANELAQSKQETSIPSTNANIERISGIEKEIATLNNEFKKYLPTIQKLRDALNHTEKTLRQNR